MNASENGPAFSAHEVTKVTAWARSRWARLH